jgi:hypothetical protein
MKPRPLAATPRRTIAELPHADLAVATACLIIALAVSACSGNSASDSAASQARTTVSTDRTAATSTTSPPATTPDKNGYSRLIGSANSGRFFRFKLAHPGPNAPVITPDKHSHGDVALADLIRRAYQRAPGLELTIATTRSAIPTPRRFVLQLRRDVVIAEEYVDPTPNGVTLVTRNGGPTYERAAHQSCWRRLAPSDPRTLVNVPGPFPDNGKVKNLTPTPHAWHAVIETHSTFWFLASQVKAPTVKNKSFLLLTINPQSHEIEGISVGQPDPAVTARMQVKTLPISPTLPTPTPSCTPA